jgi:hypothetical protein
MDDVEDLAEDAFAAAAGSRVVVSGSAFDDVISGLAPDYKKNYFFVIDIFCLLANLIRN